MSFSIRTVVLLSLSIIPVTADNSMPIPYELSIADDRAEACRHPTKSPQVTSSNTSLCFGGLEGDGGSRLHWRTMSAALHLKNGTLLIELKVRRVVIFAPGASIKLAGGHSVPVFSIMKDLELVSNFNGYGMVSDASDNNSAIFEGQLNTTVFEGHVMYQNRSRSHTIQCSHNNTLKPDFYQNDSCVACVVLTFDTRHHRASPVGWRSSSLPLCKDNGTSSASQGHLDTPRTQTRGNQSTTDDENGDEDSSGFPETGFSDYRKDLSHRARTRTGAHQGADVNTMATNRSYIEADKNSETTAKPPDVDATHSELKGKTLRPSKAAEKSSEDNDGQYPQPSVTSTSPVQTSRVTSVDSNTQRERYNTSDHVAQYPSVKIIGDERKKEIEPPGNAPEEETVAAAHASEEKGTELVSPASGVKQTSQVSDQLSSQVPRDTKKKTSAWFQSDVPPDFKTSSNPPSASQILSRKARSANRKSDSYRKRHSDLQNSSRERRSTNRKSSRDQLPSNPNSSWKQHFSNQNSSRKRRFASQSSSRKRRSANQTSSSKRHSTNQNSSSKRHSASQNSARTQRSAGGSGSHSSDDSLLETVSCELHLVADHLFFSEMGDRSTAKTVNLMLSAVIGADAVFRATDFDGDGVRDNIGFVVKNITIIHNSSAAFYGYSRTNGNSFQYLQSFSTGDFSDVCLGVAFTAIDFERGVVGLAWYASSMGGGAGMWGCVCMTMRGGGSVCVCVSSVLICTSSSVLQVDSSLL